ncbi:hypothetical protein pEaSNUABM50_00119 [Erwinia phage pEa_SNUABM_50]|uniref:Uncharacterized protein n=3 Tax=Eneladusvirus BF TaxID=2560751 RepID=A0A7L8ZM85_9CAUD|nr:hypothetical protein pEaSNUABM12_00121 [Erwinia phage pEa_SNUABM_12]QOI71604.1 hypothetical protein pEaSNUABM47_00120 [Erwinia phage pEa_SNUABM_47]QOI72143.1 hypothetical protein pEaSNUABM50_00119 [Erwinia phage pEa_SNUABM_50]QXO11268.1 hypothetical protein pEaSNUABM19_00122 [Erwinia phage pEa_SNUABM_19]QXO11816.1 hypothetical protein pEaSNUABM44_00120 [Erwinia phage pEa_SNUABM_44]QXO12368.1 hypothetical protein pEaSNUABM49_00122 [Erwinia phage pEa_SNUABM_49]
MFFKQKFKICYDNGNFVEVDDLLGYIGYTYGAAEAFYQRMKFTVKIDKSSFWSYSHSSMNDLVQTFYLFTENNIMISPELFKGEYLKYRNLETQIWHRNRLYSMKQWRHFNYRRSHTTTYDRRMETIAERRAIAGVVKEEGEPEFRGRRRCIPNPWDDIMARRSLSWKDCTKRKRQYKGS